MRFFFGFMIGAAVAGLCAAVLWPWWGPLVVSPCPIATNFGCWFTAFCGGLRLGVAWME